MKSASRLNLAFAPALLALLFTLHSPLSTACAQGTAFTYQGQLQNGGSPASGTYNLTFTLFNTNTSGVAIAGPLTNNAVSVTNGLFTVTMDFGASVWNGQTNWLQIGVATNGVSTFTLLSPRQQLTPVPYAIFAENSSNLVGMLPAAQVSGTLANGNLPSSPVFSGTVTANALAGNGSGLTNVNAATLNGLAAGNFWQLGGNNVSAGQVLGSTNNQAVQMVVGDQPVLRLIPDASGSGAPDMIGGSPVNYISPTSHSGSTHGSVIVSGGSIFDLYYLQAFTNSIAASYSTIAGGGNNTVLEGLAFPGVQPDFSFIGGGYGNTASDASVVGGGWGNTTGGFAVFSAVVGGYGNGATADGAFVGGGGADNSSAENHVEWLIGNNANAPASAVVGGLDNTASGPASFVGGGGEDEYDYMGNTASGTASVVVGGFGNSASGVGSFIGGGGDDEYYDEQGNTASGGASVVAGGLHNYAIADYSTVGGGGANYNSGIYATIPGGYNNLASGLCSFAAGLNAQATNQGAFVWADSQSGNFASTANNQFLVRSGGGVGINMNSNPDSPQTASLYAQGTNTLGWQNSVVWFQNTASSLSNAPALRVVNTSANATNRDGALSVSIQGQGIIAEFGNSLSFPVIITNNGTVYATAFVGTGSGLTGLNPADLTAGTAAINISGSAAVATNVVSDINITNAFITNSVFAGNGGGLTNVNAATLNGLAAGNFWQLGGNNVGASQILGSTNNQAVQIVVGGQRALLITTNPADSANFIGGSPANGIGAGVEGAVIAGGGTTNYLGYVSSNHISASFSSIGGGSGNSILSGSDHSFIGAGGNNMIASNDDHCVIAGGENNTNANGADVSVISGGYGNTIETNSPFSTIVGGLENTASNTSAFVGGGGYDNEDISGNTASGPVSVVVGGYGNNASGAGSFIGGGGDDEHYSEQGNTASGGASVVVGGLDNTASADYSTIPGGYHNLASGTNSFAAGQQAQALHQGAFVWADSQNAPFSSTANNQFLIRAQGGVGINTNNTGGASLYVQGNRSGGWQDSTTWLVNTNAAVNTAPALRLWNSSPNATNIDGALSVSIQGQGLIAEFGNSGAYVVTITNNGTIYATAFSTTSDRNAKEHFTQINPQVVLAKVAALPITEWSFKVDEGTRHVGPMAQDFYQAFNVGTDDKHIATVDEDGVALAAIQGLNEKVESGKQNAETQIQELKVKNAKLQTQVSDLRSQLDALQKAVARLASQSPTPLALNTQPQEDK